MVGTLSRDRARSLRQILRGLRDLDRTTATSMLLQWAAALFLAVSLSRYHVITHSGVRILLIVSASISGPVTCLGLLRATHRIRSQRFQREHLLHCALHDELTGLSNRAAMRSHLSEALHTARLQSKPLTCLYLDIDGLRYANTLLGYRAGDELLQQVVVRAGGCLAPSDHFSRFGGDKFVMLLHRSLSRSEMDALAECIVHSVSRPQILNNRKFTTGVSIGISCFPADAADDEALLAAAERAMYTVKQGGRNGFRYAEQADSPNDERNRVLADKLQRALLNDGLRLAYQPIFSHEGRIVAAEALARWHDEEEGHISPNEFIPVAESTGLIVPLSKWVLRHACEQMKIWSAAGTSLTRIAVNICVLQISRNDFVSTVELTLRETGLPAHCLELEVTESALARDFPSVKQHLQALRQLGIRISIDDFGTGYSSFGRLRELEPDALKIDRVFVQGAHEAHNGIAVVQAIVDMAHTLQLKVVAEGVETTEQLEMLRSIHCDEMQGFLLARPLAAEDISKLIAHAETKADNASPNRLNLIPSLA